VFYFVLFVKRNICFFPRNSSKTYRNCFDLFFMQLSEPAGLVEVGDGNLFPCAVLLV
jgi:hypothetical protein